MKKPSKSKAFAFGEKGERKDNERTESKKEKAAELRKGFKAMKGKRR